MMHSAAYVHSSEQQQPPVYSAGHVEGEQGRQGANAFKLGGAMILTSGWWFSNIFLMLTPNLGEMESNLTNVIYLIFFSWVATTN